ncbi:DUF2971 domain-containing protein [Methylobacter sp. Wu8]|uniref:DUF2971 domain-containing protein n=1 Tax=Methylobacter sp. Wu8 TaxID=3118457 RepID=UPI002F31C973
MKRLYRLRTINSLLGEFDELQKQSIYFAEPNELNDPMEGFRDIFWNGDAIAWKNLFKHYLLCLERFCSLLVISGEEHPISIEHIPIFSSELDLPTEEYKNLFKKISCRFFSNNTISIYINKISERSTPVRRDELLFYLSSIHPIALETIFSIYEEKNLIPKRVKQSADLVISIGRLIKDDFWDAIEKSSKEKDRGEKLIDVLFSTQRHIHSQVNLIQRYNNILSRDTKNKNLVLVEFPEEYIKKIEKLVFPEWYTACFMSDCRNSAVWGHYGNGHTGVCLVFKPEMNSDNFYISLRNKIVGWGSGGAIYGTAQHKFYPIDYIKGIGQVNFFRSIGRLPHPTLNAAWYYNEKGERSECADDIHNSEEQWRQTYWDNFYRDITVKSKDWKYENEYRLILASSMTDFSDKKDRTLIYDFSSLEGLIFGINTKNEDKLKIMEILDKKLEETGREDFKFYQAYYSPEKKCIEHKEMNLVRYNK